MTTLIFTLKDDLNKREVVFSTTMNGEGVEEYIEAYEYALLAFGFSHELVKKYLSEQRE